MLQFSNMVIQTCVNHCRSFLFISLKRIITCLMSNLLAAIHVLHVKLGCCETSLSVNVTETYRPSYTQNTNITSLKVGPQNLVLSENQKLIKTAAPFVKIPPGSYCVVVHPLDGR